MPPFARSSLCPGNLSVREHHRAPHVRGRAVVVPEPVLRLLELPPDDVDERLEHMHQITGVATQIFLTAEISRLHLNFFCITSIFE